MASAQPAAKQAAPQHLQERFFAADQALQRGDVSQAAALCQQLLAEREDYAPAYYLMAEIYSRLNQTEKALKFNDFAVRFQPGSFDIYFQRGKLMFVQSRWPEAKDAFERARQIDPKNAVAVMLLGDVAAQLGDHALAIELFNEATTIENLPEIHEHKGLSMLSMGDYEGARAAFGAMLRILPNHAPAHVYLARIDHSEGDEERAKERMQKALLSDPKHQEALAYLSDVYLHEGNHEEALTLGRRAIAAGPHHVEHCLLALKALLNAGVLAEAEQALRTLLKHNPDDLNVVIRLASILAPRGKTQEALELVERALKVVPNNEALQHTRAALSGQTTATMPEDYVARIFDSYSLNFDHHLQGVLGYRTPSFISTALRPLLPVSKAHFTLLDLGCGTGLMAEAVADITSLRVGVDLAPKMIEKAQSKGLYAETYVDEVVRYMQREVRLYDLVIAADVLVYIGDLRPLFAQAASHVAAGGFFVVSTEHADSGDDYQIRTSGRYAHTAAYIHALAATHGLIVSHEQICDLRMEAGAMLQGAIYIMQRGA